MTDTCPLCAARINPGPEPDSYESWQARLGRTDRALAEEAHRTFTTAYPDPWHVVLARRRAINDAITSDQEHIRQRDGEGAA